MVAVDPMLDPREEAEQLRRRWVDACGVYGLSAQRDFASITRMAAKLFDVPLCIIAISGATHQWFIANHGGTMTNVLRQGLCKELIEGEEEALVILDATRDPRCCNSEWVIGPMHLRFYAGAPLVVSDGIRVGTFFVADREPRHAFTECDRSKLLDFADIASRMLEQRREVRPSLIAKDLIDAGALATVVADEGGRITFWNDAAEALFGWSFAEVEGRPLETIMPERFRAAHQAGMARAVAGDSRPSGMAVDMVGLHRNGDEFPVGITVTSWQGPAGRAFGAHITDISGRKLREADLAHRASRDHLTGLLNRAEFDEQLKQRFEGEGGATLLLIDLDDFKAINDTLGHGTGDTALQTFAVRLGACLPPGGITARLGGDEFAVLLADADDLEGARGVADYLVEAGAEPAAANDELPPIRCSIGIASAPLHAADADELVVRADLALMSAKRRGGHGYRVFDGGMANRLAAKKQLSDELLRATRNGEWTLHYQPQRDLRTGALVGAEALLRWDHAERGLLYPAAFLPTLEQYLIADEVGAWVLDEMCRQLAAWRLQGLWVPQVSINLFDIQFRRPRLAAEVCDRVAAHGLAPGDIEIEVTERTALTSRDIGAASLRALKAEGVSIAFDDFGTGFASLTTVKDLPLSKLKIDRSFVRDLTDDRQSAAVIDAVLSLGRALDIHVVAEGIETEQQKGRLVALGCRWGQGYLLGHPVDPATFGTLGRSRAIGLTATV